MRLIEKEHAFFLNSPGASQAVIGFSKPTLEGDPVTDVPKAIANGTADLEVSYMKQVHGPEIRIVEEPGQYVCDGMFTKKAGLALVVKTADCMPIIFYSPSEGIAGVVHMGWRSAKDGILDNIKFDLSAFTVIAGVGMRKCCYKVGEEFTGYPSFKGFVDARDGSYYFDPIGFISSRLVQKGMKEENFTDQGTCSYCSSAGFFSHRRTATKSRTLSFVMKNRKE
jgi:YfiH family protein